MNRRSTALPALAVVALLALGGCGDDATDATGSDDASAGTDVALADPDGGDAGTVTYREVDGGVEVTVSASGLTEGFHGFHVHTTGVCEPDSANPTDPTDVGDFLSAGGHLAEEGELHSEHTGDMPSLKAGADGTAQLTYVDAGLSTDVLEDEDGSAFMVHAGPDNFGNVPERYAPGGPDEDTLKTGDSGDRVACGATG